MERAPKKLENVRQEEIVEQVKKILKERGSKPLEMARKAVLDEKIECKQVREALEYFMIRYLHNAPQAALLSLACESVGGAPSLTIPIAVPMILLNSGVDIQDDIIDQSKSKDSRPTVYGKFGKDIALLVGDLLIMKGFMLLYKTLEMLSPEKRVMIMGILENSFLELGDAEALELAFRGHFDVSPEEYLRVVQKRAANVEAHTRIGGIIGDGTKHEIEALGGYGRALGVLFIIRDDFVDMFDFNEIRHRMIYESLPLPLLFAFQNSGVKRKSIKILQKKEVTSLEKNTFLKIVLESEEVEEVKGIIQEYAKKSQKNLKKLRKTLQLQLLVTSVVRGLE
ncbi:MAG: polyprenyl synthetase family protein [Thermoproteota archaeon]|nr:polyprenyl synthetase family protein [Thermoproteota archaeon]